MDRPVARVSMLVRRPPADVFAAFVDPTWITRFWLESTSGPLTVGARVTWRFMVPGASDEVTVTAIDAPSRIELDWSDGSHVVLAFDAHGGDATRVGVETSGFAGEDPVAAALDTVEGYAIVLCDLKTLLESGRSAGLVRDKARLIAASMSVPGEG